MTGEGWYTAKLDAHMPSWFYSGGNSNIGAQKLALIVKDGQARLKTGTLAGSVLTMKQALYNLIHRFGIAPVDAVRMCTATPAECIG